MSDYRDPVDPDHTRVARTGQLTAKQANAFREGLALIGEPVRARLLSARVAAEEMRVGDIALALDLSEDAVSYGLRVLGAADLVHPRAVGRMAYYRLADEPKRAPLLDTLGRLTELAEGASSKKHVESRTCPADCRFRSARTRNGDRAPHKAHRRSRVERSAERLSHHQAMARVSAGQPPDVLLVAAAEEGVHVGEQQRQPAWLEGCEVRRAVETLEALAARRAISAKRVPVDAENTQRGEKVANSPPRQRASRTSGGPGGAAPRAGRAPRRRSPGLSRARRQDCTDWRAESSAPVQPSPRRFDPSPRVPGVGR